MGVRTRRAQFGQGLVEIRLRQRPVPSQGLKYSAAIRPPHVNAHRLIRRVWYVKATIHRLGSLAMGICRGSAQQSAIA